MTVSTSEDESRRGPPNVRSTSEIGKPAHHGRQSMALVHIIQALIKMTTQEAAPAPEKHLEWPHEAVCRLIHDNAGTKDPDDPWPHPAQKSWEEPMLKRWQQWEGLSDELRELLGFQRPQSYELYAPSPQPREAGS